MLINDDEKKVCIDEDFQRWILKRALEESNSWVKISNENKISDKNYIEKFEIFFRRIKQYADENYIYPEKYTASVYEEMYYCVDILGTVIKFGYYNGEIKTYFFSLYKGITSEVILPYRVAYSIMTERAKKIKPSMQFIEGYIDGMINVGGVPTEAIKSMLERIISQAY